MPTIRDDPLDTSSSTPAASVLTGWLSVLQRWQCRRLVWLSAGHAGPCSPPLCSLVACLAGNVGEWILSSLSTPAASVLVEFACWHAIPAAAYLIGR